MSTTDVSTPEAIDLESGFSQPRTITAHDRCDGCGHAAAVAVMLGDSELLFCAHHYNAAEVKLAALGAVLTGDRRHDIK